MWLDLEADIAAEFASFEGAYEPHWESVGLTLRRKKNRPDFREVPRKASWWKKNRDRINAERRAERARKARRKRRRRAWLEANRERVRLVNLAWAQANREKVNADKRAWRLANREKVNAQKKAWRLAKKEKEKATPAP